MFKQLLACAALLLPMPVLAGTFDVAPTTLDLSPGVPGLFYVSNRGSQPVTVQLEPMDWKQDAGGDVRTPSKTLLVSPQFATIAPGGRQSVRVMARSGGETGEQTYRLMVSEIPSAADTGMGVHVLLQFSVPVFAGHDTRARPMVSFKPGSQNGKPVLEASNSGTQTVKLAGLSIDGVPQPGDGFFYVLPGATRSLTGAATHGQVTARDQRSQTDIRTDIAAN